MIRPNLTAGSIIAALLGAGICTLALYAVFGAIGTDPRWAFVCGAFGVIGATVQLEGSWRRLHQGLVTATFLYLLTGWGLGSLFWYRSGGGLDCLNCLYATFLWGFVWAPNVEWSQLWQLIWEWIT